MKSKIQAFIRLFAAGMILGYKMQFQIDGFTDYLI